MRGHPVPLRKAPWAFIAALATGAILAACASQLDGNAAKPDSPVPQQSGIQLFRSGALSRLDSAQALDSAGAFMAAAGCPAVNGGPSPNGTVLVPVPPAGARRYDCSALGKDSTHKVVRSYMHRMSSWIPGNHEEEGYYDMEQVFTVHCSGPGTTEYHVPGGEQIVVTDAMGNVTNSWAGGETGTDLYLVCEAPSSSDFWGFNAVYDDDEGNPTTPPANDWGGTNPPGANPMISTTPVPSTYVVSLSLTPATQTVAIGDNLGVGATATYNDGSTAPISPVWTLSATNILVPDDANTWDAVGSGTLTLTASVPDGGTGFVTATATITVAECNAADPSCAQPLVLAQMKLLRSARSAYIKTVVADTLAQRECTEAVGWLDQALGAMSNADTSTHVIYVGSTGSQVGDSAHSGETLTPGAGKLHIDPWLFDSASNGSTQAVRDGYTKMLIRATLHETAHAIGGKTHPPATSIADYAGVPYFGSIESTGPRTSCLTQ